MELTSIVVPVMNQVEYTMEFMETLYAFTPEPFELIVVDNASSDDTQQFMVDLMSKNPNIMYLRNERNLGCAGALHQGARAAKGKYIAFCNNDILFSKEWLKGMIDCVESGNDVGLVGARTNFISGPQIVTEVGSGYQNVWEYQKFAENFRSSFKGCYIPFWQIRPFCGLIKREVYNKIEGFDPQYFPANCEDDDLCMQLVQAGYRNLICGDVFIHHHGSKSMGINDELGKASYISLVNRMSKIYAHKWINNMDKTISASLIVKNEAHNIERCLENLHPYVDEIIIVDTGSTDNTVELAKKFPKVKTFEFEWIDDFAAARNFADSKATSAWILSVDADEILTGLDIIREDIRPYAAYRICTRNYTTNIQYSNLHYNDGEYPDHEVGVAWFPSTKIRLYPRHKNICWEYPVHEVVENSIYHLGMSIIEYSKCVVHHISRVDDTQYTNTRAEKYYELLKKNAANGKRDLRCLEQLAVQAQGMKKYDEAESFWHEVLEIDPSGQLAPLNLTHIWAERKDWETAKGWATKAYLLNPDNKDVQQNLGLCSFHTGDYVIAEKMAKGLLSKEPMNPLGKALLGAITEMKKIPKEV